MAALRTVLVLGALAASLAACATAPTPSARLAGGDGRVRAYNRPYEVRGRWYTPTDQPGYDRVGLASWYSYESRSRTTADGEPFDARLATAAHTTLPIPSWLEVTNLDNGRSARVRLNDRGPFVSGRILDLSRAAAVELGFLQQGTARVRVRYLGPAEPFGGARTMWAQAPRSPARPSPRPRRTDMMLAEADPRPAAVLVPSTHAGPSMAQAEVDKDLADFAAEDASAPMAAPGPSLPASPEEGGGFAVQAGAFADRGNAERAAARLAGAGPATVRPLTRSDGAVLYRVLVGGWAGADQAAAARDRIAAQGFGDARVVEP